MSPLLSNNKTAKRKISASDNKNYALKPPEIRKNKCESVVVFVFKIVRI